MSIFISVVPSLFFQLNEVEEEEVRDEEKALAGGNKKGSKKVSEKDRFRSYFVYFKSE